MSYGQYRKPRDVAAQLDVALCTVYGWIAAGKLASVRCPLGSAASGRMTSPAFLQPAVKVAAPRDSGRDRGVARQQNERDATAGYCTRYVEDVGVLTRVAIIMAEPQPQGQEDGGGRARSA